jgi:hypothetical protein
MFGEQVAQRRDRYAQQNIDTAWRGSQIPMQAIGAMQARQEMGYNALRQQALQQEMQLQSQQVASQLATDELKRQDAMQQLQWARELHSTDMIQMQKDMMAEDLALKRAEVKRRTQELEGGVEVQDYLRANPDHMVSAYALGMEPYIEGNRVRFRELQDKSLQQRAQASLMQVRGQRDYTRSELTRQMEAASKVLENPDAPEEARDAAQRLLLQSTQALAGTSEGVAIAPKPKPAPDPMENPEFRKRVESTVSAQPMLVANMGAKNSERLMKHVLADPEPWREMLKSEYPNREFSDQEIASIVSGYAVKASRSSSTTEDPQIQLWQVWINGMMEANLLDRQEYFAAQEAMGESSSAASAAGRNIK